MYLEADENVLHIELQPVCQIIEPYQVTCKRCRGAGNRRNIKTSNMNKCNLCKGTGTRTKIGAVYTADFKVTYKDGYTEVIDVKGGPVTRDFPLRKKLLECITGQEVVVVRWKSNEWVRE